MTLQGLVVIDFIAIVLLLWVLNLVRRGHLYVGYGVFFIASLLAIVAIVSVPKLLMVVTRLVGAVFPASALTLVAFSVMGFMFVYVLTQLTILSNRVATLVQELAIRRTQEGAGLVPGQIESGVMKAKG